MTQGLIHFKARKLAWRKQLAALPVGEKLRMLEEMVKSAQAISSTRPPKPTVSVRKRKAESK